MMPFTLQKYIAARSSKIDQEPEGGTWMPPSATVTEYWPRELVEPAEETAGAGAQDDSISP